MPRFKPPTHSLAMLSQMMTTTLRPLKRADHVPSVVGRRTASKYFRGFFFGEIGERLHACFADCAQEGERRIEHEGLLLRFVAVECGIVRREWAQIAVSAAHRTETERAGRHDRSTSDEQSAAARHLQRPEREKTVQCPPNEGDDSEK